MACEGSATDIVQSNSDQENKANPDNIPGGAQIPIPNEPTPEIKAIKEMGCATSNSDSTTDDPKKEETKLKTGQTQVTDYFDTVKKSGNDSVSTTKGQSRKKQKTDAASSNHRQISKTSTGTMSDDDDMETESNQHQSGPVTRSKALSALRINFPDSDDEDNTSHSSWAQRDISDYRSGYPHARNDSRITDNYDFYTNKIASHPDGDTIDNIHKKWFGDYRKLEFHHGYIQWLFPIQEKGLNWSSEALQKHEIEKIKKDKKAMERILKSYKLMLDFYGFELVNKETGEIGRSTTNSFRDRFRNLNTSSHNYLRITRILKCLGEFDYEYLKFPFLEAILRESITENTLANCLRSCKDYWIETLRSSDERRAIRQYAKELIKYRNKGITPPPSYRAVRPPPTSTQINNAPSSKKQDGPDND